MLGFSIIWTKNFQMSKLSLVKEEAPEIKLTVFARSQRKQGHAAVYGVSKDQIQLIDWTEMNNYVNYEWIEQSIQKANILRLDKKQR